MTRMNPSKAGVSSGRRCRGAVAMPVPALAQTLPEQADEDRGRILGRRSVRHHLARGRRQDGRNPRRAGRDREQDRRRRNDRDRSRGTRRSRRLHAPQHAARQRGQRDADQDRSLQGRQGHDRGGPQAETANMLVVHPSLGVKNVAELIELAKSKPGEVLYATAGRGSATHLPASSST